MTERYVSFCVDLRDQKGREWLQIEAEALIDHNEPQYQDGLVIYIESYWTGSNGEYAELPSGVSRDLDDYEDQIEDQIRDVLIEELELEPAPNEHYFDHHECGLGVR